MWRLISVWSKFKRACVNAFCLVEKKLSFHPDWKPRVVSTCGRLIDELVKIWKMIRTLCWNNVWVLLIWNSLVPYYCDNDQKDLSGLKIEPLTHLRDCVQRIKSWGISLVKGYYIAFNIQDFIWQSDGGLVERFRLALSIFCQIIIQLIDLLNCNFVLHWGWSIRHKLEDIEKPLT